MTKSWQRMGRHQDGVQLLLAELLPSHFRIGLAIQCQAPGEIGRPGSAFGDSKSKLRLARRGEQVFRGAAACADCHRGSRFTDGEIHDVGLGARGDRYRGFNTPTLLGVGRKVKLLHDGRVSSLEALLKGPHNPEDVAGAKLDDQQLSDLIQYLREL